MMTIVIDDYDVLGSGGLGTVRWVRYLMYILEVVMKDNVN